MHITLVMDQYDNQNNGTTITSRRLAEALRNAGYTVTVLACGKPEEGKICARKKTIPFFQRLIESQGMCFAKPDPALYYEAFKDADVVHFFMPFRFCRMGEKYARQMGIPSVASFHVQPENITSTIFLNKWKGLNDWIYRLFYKSFYNRFSYIHAPSIFIAGQLKDHGYDAKIHVISNGVSSVFRKIDVEKPDEWKDKFVILMVGRFSREKRQDILIKAVQESKYSDRIQLVLAGKGPTYGRYARLAKNLSNPVVMKFFNQEDLIKVMNQSDLYVHTSDAEIEGISAMEAMACGLVPVISDSKLSATHQYALNPQSLFTAGDSSDLANKIDYWIEHPKEKAIYSELYAKQQDNNRVDACTQKMIEFYKEAILNNPISQRKDVPSSRVPLTPFTKKLDQRLIVANKKKGPTKDNFISALSHILTPIHYGMFGLRVVGQENLENLDGGAVTVCNHIHLLDCTMVKSVLRNKKVWFISLKENFKIPIVGYLVKALGAVPLSKDIAKIRETKQRLEEQLKNGDIVHFYPEGMLVPYCEDLRPMRSGAFHLAVRANRPVIPMVFCLREGKGIHQLKHKPCFTLCIGELVYPDQSLPFKEARVKLQEQVSFQMQKMLNQSKDETFKYEYTVRRFDIVWCLLFSQYLLKWRA